MYLAQKIGNVFANSILVRPKEENCDSYEFYIEVQVSNEGKHVTYKYKIGYNILNAVGISVNYERDKNYTFTNALEESIKISSNEIIPIFPNEIFNALCLSIKISRMRFYEILEKLKFFVLTYNVIDFEEIEFNLADLLKQVKEKYY